MHANWLPTIKILLRLQARYWPYVRGQSKVLYTQGPKQEGDRPTLDALHLEYRHATAQDALEQLAVTTDDLIALAEWLAWRVEGGVDPQPRLRSLTRLLPRRHAERARGRSLQALDLYDAFDLVRRFHNEVTGELMPDADQRNLVGEAARPRPLRKDRDALVQALRTQGLTAHKLHIIVEGETEIRLVTGLFEAFSRQTLDAAGIAMTDLEGDKLEESRRFIQGLGLYSRDIVLLLDDENDAKRVVQQMADAGTVRLEYVHLASPSLEEENFSPEELVALANRLAAAHGVQLGFTGADLAKKHSEHNERSNGPPLGMASMLVRMARNPTCGPVVLIRKPDLVEPMLELLFAEIEAAPGRHQEIAARRPIVDWVLKFPLQAARIP